MTTTRLVALILLSLATATAIIALAKGGTGLDTSPVVAVRGVSPDATSDNGQHKLARTGDGTLYLAFSAPVDGLEQAQIYFSLDQGQTWKPDVVLAQEGVWSDLPTLAVGDDGRIDAAWVDYTGVGQVWHSSKADGEWSTFEKISPGETYAGFPAMVIRESMASVLWYAAPPDETREHGSAYEIFHTEKDAQGWTNPVLLSSDSEDALNPALAQDDQGNLHGAWFQIVQQTYGAQHAFYDGTTWDVPLLVSPVADTATGVAIEVDASGVPHMVWEQSSGDDIGIAYAKLDGDEWTEPLMLSESHSLDPVLAFDTAGDLFVMWSENGHITARVHDGGWSAAYRLGEGTNPALLGGDTVMAAWTEDSAPGPVVMVGAVERSGTSDSSVYWVTTVVALLAGVGLLYFDGRRSALGDTRDR